MRHLLILAALLLASGARSQTLGERIIGDWVSADSIGHVVPDENGVAMVDENGDTPFWTLYEHISFTDSTHTSTSVSRAEGTLQGAESAGRYEVRDSAIVMGNGQTIAFDVRGDSLIISQESEAGERDPRVYLRAAPLRTPEALLGDWISGPMTDNAGVVFDLAFRFRADGTFLAGAADEPSAFRLLGPYVMIEDVRYADPQIGVDILLFNVSHSPATGAALSETDPKQVTLRLGDESITLYRTR